MRTGHSIDEKNFSILDNCHHFDLKVLESIHIHDKQPDLNDFASSAKLFILK